MFRFFLPYKITDPQNIVITDKEIVNKLNKVLRKKTGDIFIIFDNQANEYRVVIKEINSKKIQCSSLGKTSVNRELDKQIILYQTLVKKDKFEWILQKATEIGVKKIVPLNSENCVVKELNQNKLRRYEKILNEATMQSGGKITPVLDNHLDFEQALNFLNKKDLNLIAHEQEKENKLINILQKEQADTINLFIGPEGGFSPLEINLAKKYSLKTFSLGKRILRSETAAIVACGIIANY